MKFKAARDLGLWIGLLLVALVDLAGASEKKHKAAITAQELLPLMTACDLLAPAHTFGYPQNILSEMCTKGKRLLKIGMSSPGPEAWTWQPGKMSDHDDFKYAGNTQISGALKEKKIPGISLDSAHFYAKWPLFFLSAKNASTGNERIFFDDAIVGLVTNLFDGVVDVDEKACIVRYKNYIDGTNGVYRWNWRGKGDAYGHSAYGLSYTPFFSSTALLNREVIADHYRTISSCYPYSVEARKKFFWGRGLEEERLLVMLSEKRPDEIKKGERPTQAALNYYNQYFSKRIDVKNSISTEDAYAAVVGDRMLVMHYAFYMDYAPWIDDFQAYVEKASKAVCVGCHNMLGFYEELHLIYFLGKYLNLVAASPYAASSGNQKIFARVVARIESLYLEDQPEMISIYGWDGVRMYNFKDYVDWKLSYYADRPGRVGGLSLEEAP